MHHPERSRHKSASERKHIRKVKAALRKAERESVLPRSGRIFSSEKAISQQETFVKLLSMNEQKRLQELKVMPEVQRGHAFGYEPIRRMNSIAFDIQSGRITDLGQVERILDRVGPLCGLFTAFGDSNPDMSISSNRLLGIIKGNLSALTGGKK